MNIIYSIILCYFIFITLGAADNSNQQSDDQAVPPNSIKLGIVSEGNVLARVFLKQTKRVLANKHLPIWISIDRVGMTALKNDGGKDLKRNYEVMEQLGEFTTYHDPGTSSAAIYFHKLREFESIIGYEFLIRKLSIDSINPTEETLLQFNQMGVYRRPHFKEHEYDGGAPYEDPAAGVNNQEHRKTYEAHLYDGYPEVLVIVSWEVTRHITLHLPEAERYPAIVSHVLTSFNGVDMLYSKLEKTKIQINIAGIIIGTSKHSFTFLNRCHQRKNSKTADTHIWLNGDCANPLLQRYLHARTNTIPSDSYDLVIFLAGKNILSTLEIDEKKVAVHAYGLAHINYRQYACRRINKPVVLLATVTSKRTTENYVTIAHEIAHLMTLQHDEAPFYTDNGKCCAGILKPMDDGWCGKCMSWSATSEESFNLFFSSPNCCAFINKPQSLYPPGRQFILTSDEQCRCHGYESAKKFSKIPANFCHFPMECKVADYKVDFTVVPMHGTPCGDHQVCWQKRCQEIEVDKTSPSVM